MKLFQVYQKAVSFLIVRDKREAFVAKTIRQASHFILKIAPPVWQLVSQVFLCFLRLKRFSNIAKRFIHLLHQL